MNKKILIISPYDAMSHRQWREGITAEFPQISFTVVTLPPRYFAWRHRGNSLTLAFDTRLDQHFDLILATSMTDLSALKGMQPRLAAIPAILYFHENQFAYPEANADQGQLERQLTSIYSAVTADQLVFNSNYNRKTFLEGAGALLKKMPDHVPAGVMDILGEKAKVLPVPLNNDIYQTEQRKDRFSIVWNHRWEYDKGLQDLQEIIKALLLADIDFIFHIIGQQFRRSPEIMLENIDILGTHAGKVGFIESRTEYLALLASSHMVLSTAEHEFQGLAVLEAVACGCVPIVPHRLVYPELFEEKYCYYDTSDAVERLSSHAGQSAPDVSHLSWRAQRSAWQKLFELPL